MGKVVLAYSGGLDTSCAIQWIKENYGLDVICFSAFIGEVKNAAALRKRALATGASKAYIVDLKAEFARDFILPALHAHAKYEDGYLLATSLGRPLIAKHLVEVAHKEKAEYVAHGCTGKGNDQVRIEVGVHTLDSKLKIIAPLKEWSFKSREEEIEYAQSRNIPIQATKKSPYSIDKNIWGVAIEAGHLEDPWTEPSDESYMMTVPPSKAPKNPVYVTIDFKNGVPVRLNGKTMPLVSLIEKLNEIGGRYGVGRLDMIENRLVGIKSREIYEAPGASILMYAHESLEALVLDRELIHYKQVLSHKYAELVYYGLWFTPLKEALDAFFREHQKRVNGTVRLKLDRGHIIMAGRKSPNSLYQEKLATYSAGDTFDHTAANGFIKLWGLPYEKKI